MHKKNMSTCFFAGMAAVLSLFMLVPASTAVAGTSLPVFTDHLVKEQFTGTPALPDFANNPDAKRFATRIKEGAKQAPNFAGHYTIIEWGCGSECQSSVIVDAKTGAIFSPSFTSSWGLLYRPDSSLLIVNPLTPEVMAGGSPPDWLVSRYYTWDGKKLAQIAENKTATIDPKTGAAPGTAEQKKLTVIDYYNMNKHDNLRIENKDGVWKGQGDSGWYALKAADIANGYVEYEDPGYNNGAGHATYSGALFLTGDRQPMFALLQTITSTESKCPDTNYTLETYRMQGDHMTEGTDVVPPLPPNLFLKKGASTDIVTTYSIGYRLPRKGTTVEAFLDTSYISCMLEKSSKDMKKKDLDAAREFLKNARTEPVKLKWNKATGRFDLTGNP